jgi:4-oxalocrotonate tautomerase
VPVVNVQVTREGSGPGRDSVTTEEKAAIIKGMSEVLRDVLHKPLESTFVIIEEVEVDNWGWGGLPALEFRAELAAKRAGG